MSRSWIILMGITLLAGMLRFLNLSPFTLYPDSYQNLIVAQNLLTYGSVAGFLGTNGMFYPDFFMWTRPIFPLLINAVSSFGITPLIAARSIAFVLGILAIPIAYLFVKKVFNNGKAGLIASFVLAVSFNHTVWSGLLMTEAIGVFCMFVFLWQFFMTVAKTTGFLKMQNILTGVLFALAVLSRYEYLIIALPVILYIFRKSPNPYTYLLSFFGSFIVVLVIIGYFIYPFTSVVPVIFSQLSDLLIKIGLAVGFFILCYFVYRFLPKHVNSMITQKFPAAVSIFLGLVFVVCIPIVSFNLSHVFGFDISMFRDFFKHDFLISLFSFIGLLKLLEEKKQHTLAYFVLLSIVLLGFIYYHINPEMERYMTHLIPFLLIPSVFGIQKFYETAFINQTKRMRFILNGIIVLLVVSQLVVTARGLRNLNDPSWYQASYEEKAAVLIGAHITGNPLLITSFPEPYYYFLKLDTQSVADQPPFLYIPSSQNNRTVVIVEDMGMRDVFPNFTRELDTKLQKYKYATFSVHEQYHYTNNSVPENSLVVLYRIKLGDFKKLLR